VPALVGGASARTFGTHVQGALVDDSIVAVTREAAAISVEGDAHRLGSVQRGVRPEDEVKEATLVVQAASNLIDFVGRKDSRRLPDSHPPNRDARFGWYPTANVDGAAEGNAAGVLHAGAVEHHAAGSDEDVVLQHGARHVGVGTDQYVAAKTHGMARCSSKHRVFHHHASLSDLHAPAVVGEDGSEQDSDVGSDLDVARQDGRGRDVRLSVDERLVAGVFDQHGAILIRRLDIKATNRPSAAHVSPGCRIGEGNVLSLFGSAALNPI
jgi:hypothetical protein